MLFGGHVKSLDHIDILKTLNFDFGELVLRDAKASRFWLDSGVKNRFDSRFFLIAHGPFEGPPNDMDNIRTRYRDALTESIDTASQMEIDLLTIHLWMDHRFVKPEILERKVELLRYVVEYGHRKNVRISLENLSESAADLRPVFESVTGLGLTLDVAHAQLLTETNTSFEIIADLGRYICHVHLHDNRGGNGPSDDLHLPVGEGIIDFPAILGALVKLPYDGTITLELEPEDLERSRNVVEQIIANLNVRKRSGQ
ncbi:MAG: sugar phosphate isomerase/epimerase [Deltaproteobacteria bacterium]